MPLTDQTETEFKVTSKYSNSGNMVMVHSRESPAWKARLACALIEKWGLVAAAPDGEDSSGRAKLRKLTPTELVAEATEVADLAVEEFRRRNWVTELPSFSDVEKAPVQEN